VRRVIAFVLVALPLFIGLAHGKSPTADQILRKAEAIRNPELDYAVDFTIHGVSRAEKPIERDATYSMIARGKDRTVILMRTPESLYGALVMMVDRRYWMLLPKASKPWELSGAQMQNGDVATGDLARANLMRGYTATLAGDETIDDAACWRLELHAEDDAARYARIVYWVSKSGFLPRRLDHYGRAGKLLKTVRYGDYRQGALGLRSMQLTIESLDEWKEASTLTFSNLRKIDPRRASLTPDGMLSLRDAAMAARETDGATDVALERILGLSASRKMR
jgi:hypothetical protein